MVRHEIPRRVTCMYGNWGLRFYVDSESANTSTTSHFRIKKRLILLSSMVNCLVGSGCVFKHRNVPTFVKARTIIDVTTLATDDIAELIEYLPVVATE